MARKLRIQFPGAIYHVINRGNYRRDLFISVGEAQGFLDTVREARDLMGWRVHAYVLMRNHYHLAIETPEPNLVEGMHWLQSAWATRFNRYRQERGHLFQGRYQSLLIERQANGVRPLFVALTDHRLGVRCHEARQQRRHAHVRLFLPGQHGLRVRARHHRRLPFRPHARLREQSQSP